MSALQLLVADDHEIVRQGLRSVLESQRDCKVVGEAVDGRQAVSMTKELNPDVVILDIGMPSLNGLEATRQILKMRPQTKVLILTMHESDSLIREVLDAGACGFILKTDAGRDLVSAVDSLRRNKPFFTPRVSQMILDGFLKGDRRTQETPPSSDERAAGAWRRIARIHRETSSRELNVLLHAPARDAVQAPLWVH